jgi:hypothetical protein
MHRYVGAYNGTYPCLQRMKGEDCPICAEEQAARKSGDQDGAKKLNAQPFWCCYVLERDSEAPTKPQVWIMSNRQDDEILSLTKDKRSGEPIQVSDPENGFDLSFRRTQTGKDVMTTRYDAFVFDRSPSPVLDKARDAEDLLDEITDNTVPDVIKYYEADYLHRAMSGSVEQKDDDLDDDDEPKPREAKRSSQPGRYGYDDEEKDQRFLRSERSERSDENEYNDDRPRQAKQDEGEDEDEDEVFSPQRDDDDPDVRRDRGREEAQAPRASVPRNKIRRR